eukprot:TRINITY_DN7782_c0_g1_i1.p1 TRINITY_DN7782_c0_g1~~TRINITY_DN7782_c0_g1_i1.p1  ORF type:complete len:473 (-),score=126.56 TRINITY_DN7782_c0_g1_i1:41-1363(-)
MKLFETEAENVSEMNSEGGSGILSNITGTLRQGKKKEARDDSDSEHPFKTELRTSGDSAPLSPRAQEKKPMATSIAAAVDTSVKTVISSILAKRAPKRDPNPRMSTIYEINTALQTTPSNHLVSENIMNELKKRIVNTPNGQSFTHRPSTALDLNQQPVKMRAFADEKNGAKEFHHIPTNKSQSFVALRPRRDNTTIGFNGSGNTPPPLPPPMSPLMAQKILQKVSTRRPSLTEAGKSFSARELPTQPPLAPPFPPTNSAPSSPPSNTLFQSSPSPSPSPSNSNVQYQVKVFSRRSKDDSALPTSTSALKSQNFGRPLPSTPSNRSTVNELMPSISTHSTMRNQYSPSSAAQFNLATFRPGRRAPSPPKKPQKLTSGKSATLSRTPIPSSPNPHSSQMCIKDLTPPQRSGTILRANETAANELMARLDQRRKEMEGTEGT